jgi:hypothetical protein
MGAGGEANKGTPWKLLLQIGPDAPASIVAHEIGHVLGMIQISKHHHYY